MTPTGDWIGELRAAATHVQESPLHAMSLGSKELFHSNLIAWIATRVGPRRAFPTWMTPDENANAEPDVQRERQHLDLVLRDRGRQPLVIENKTFAVPDQAQLARYAESIGGYAPAAVLLSLIRPSWDSPYRVDTRVHGVQLQWFDFERVDRALGDSRSRGHRSPDRWLRYDPDFIYRYRKTSDLTLAELVEVTVGYAVWLCSEGSS